MSNREFIENVEEVVRGTIEDVGFDLIETEYLSENGRWTLRLYIDSPGKAVSLGDCEKTSRAVSALLDVEDVLPQRYNLEVSSPGINRPLRREKDFKRFAGSTVKLKTVEKMGDQRNFKGIIEGVKQGFVIIKEETKTVEISIDNILKARLLDATGGK